MRLADATSSKQVERHLEEGDEELRGDIEDKLDTARRWWNDRGISDFLTPDDERIDFKEIVTREDFVDQVIKDSPSEYDLANIPRWDVEAQLRWDASHEGRGSRRGPFYVCDTRDRFSYEIATELSAHFPYHQVPENGEFIPSDIADEFWGSLDGGVTWEQTDRVEENYGSAEGDTIYVCAGADEFAEWCRDLISEHVDQLIKRSPTGAIELFMLALKQESPLLAEKTRAAGLPEEELLDFAAQWFQGGSSQSDIISTLHDYFEAVEVGAAEPREAIGEWTQADLKKIGISKGVLYEEAPWRLIKMHPGDLRLEGTLMRHCVGDRGMGYIKALTDGEIELWSLRSRTNKPRFTVEVDTQFYAKDIRDQLSAHGDPVTNETLRAETIKQLKGKANRTPGFADVRQQGGLKFPDEVVFWQHVLRGLGVDPEGVNDLRPALAFSQPKVVPNPGDICVGFDTPYRGLP